MVMLEPHIIRRVAVPAKAGDGGATPPNLPHCCIKNAGIASEAKQSRAFYESMVAGITFSVKRSENSLHAQKNTLRQFPAAAGESYNCKGLQPISPKFP
jgi:hypothetical protein